MKTVSWGIIGVGDVCEKKGGPPLYSLEHCRLVGVTRRNLEAAEDFCRRHDAGKVYPSYEALLADDEIDAIYVATPHDLHEANTIEAAAAGKHVLVEKPMALSAESCQRMIAACDAAGVTLGVAYYRRCYPTILRAKELVDAGAIGAVKEIHINDEFPLSHRLDLFHFFCGDAESVWAREEDLPPGSHAPRGAMLHARMANGTECITPVGWEEKLAPETVLLVGETGRVCVDNIKSAHLWWERNGERVDEPFAPLPATHWGLVDNFVKYLSGEAPLACNGVEGRKSTVILDIVQELAPDGAEVPVRYEA